MSLVEESHITPTHLRRDAHYYLKNGKMSMTIWNREHSEITCPDCFYGLFHYQQECPRCKKKIQK